MQTDRKIIRTLLVSSLVIASMVTLTTLLLEYVEIEKRVITLAKSELHHLVQNLQSIEDIEKTDIDLSQTNFLLISLYNRENRLVFSQEKASYKRVKEELKTIDHHIDTSSKEGVEERIIHNQIENRFYFEFKIPVDMKKFQGSIKGLYKISNFEMQKIYKRIFYSLLQLIVTVFVTTLLLYPIIVYLNNAYKQQAKELLHANLDILSVLGGAIAKRDNETNAHNYRVTLYAISFGETLNLSREKMRALIKGAFLHDVGKIGVSDTILLKPDRLTKEEFTLMKKHVSYGVEIIENSAWLADAKDVVAYHHERYDSKGYMKGLSNEEIPLIARIFMICDVFDALSSQRPYKNAFSFDKSIEMIKEESGTHFDPSLVPVFCSIIEKVYKQIGSIEDEKELRSMLDKKLHYFEFYE